MRSFPTANLAIYKQTLKTVPAHVSYLLQIESQYAKMVAELKELIIRRIVREFVEGSRLAEIVVDARNVSWVQKEGSTMSDKLLAEAKKVETKMRNNINLESIDLAVTVFKEMFAESLINSLTHIPKLTKNS